MSGSTVAEIALGLALVYAVLALFVTSIARLLRTLPGVPPAITIGRWSRQHAQLLVVLLAVAMVGALNADTFLVVRGLSGTGAPRAVIAVPAATAGTGAPAIATAAGGGSETRNGVFISYSHRDTAALDELRVALKPYERAAGLVVWDDRQIAPGQEWEAEILGAIARSRVAVMLVSPDFLASDYVANVELPALTAQRADGLVVLWVALRPSAYAVTEVAQLQAVNNPGTPLAMLSGAERDRAFVEVAGRIAAPALGPAADGEPAVAFAGASVAVAGSGAPLGWQNAYERLSWAPADVAIKVLAGLALSVLAVVALEVLWAAALGRATSPARREGAPRG
ncbi:MAG: toll/interleukin-1 receptor domain-containing protein [Chloroflexi bacterium]|nr:toll/interleukin-1 receptor domain-containing protein [Chloroflexota bacterium]